MHAFALNSYQALISNEWDVVVVMLGTNDARDAGSGGPEHWPREHCDHATAETLPACPFAQDYAALVQVGQRRATRVCVLGPHQLVGF